ncbi:MAG: DNA repair protein RecO [Rickettsiales bacterium]|nr:DNA repair protein RecO [Rickettsiales bacterium]
MSIIEDEGFIINLKKYNERSTIVELFSKNNGVISSFLKDKNIKSDKYKNQVGAFSRFSCEFNGVDKYGNIEVEVIENFLDIFFKNKIFMLMFNSMISILNGILIKRNDVGFVYRIFKNVMFSFRDNNKSILLNYVDFLFAIVEFLGININLDECVLDGEKVEYISPKTGSGISKNVGEKYKNKLFDVPLCFVEYSLDKKEIVKAINILHFFIYKFCKENNILSKYKPIKIFKNGIIKQLQNV